MSKEHEMVLSWLAKRGRPVAAPTPYIGALVATRNVTPGRSLPWLLLFGVAGLAGAIGYQRLFGVTAAAPVYFFCFVVQLTMWRAVRSRQRQLAGETRPWPGATRDRSVLGGWFTVALAFAYAGGAALAVSLFPTASAYALSWLGLLVLSALCGGVVLAGFLRAPVLAEGPESLAVYRGLLAEHMHAASPALVAFPPLLDALGHRLPPGYGPVLIAYFALVAVAELLAYLRNRRPLPPGRYGDPRPARSAVDWTPPEPR
ncbi:hypothetical protein OHS18_24510 [Amycolatopsis sp. NBC_00355]|uniref:hypothetical protein n=1 Tax=Amycolatopsis sp. NBC_00355 TaxID=2975957 RepID=UPI002E25288E